MIVSALDKDDEFLNYQTMTGTVLGPDMQSIPLDDRADRAGRYVGEFESAKPGSYMIMVTPGAGQAMIRTGVNIGYSDEFRDRETNTPLLESIAELPAKGGEPGKLMPPLPEVPEEKAEQDAGAAIGGRSVSPRLAAGRGQPGYLAVAGAGGELRVFGRRVRPPRAGQSSYGSCRFGTRFAGYRAAARAAGGGAGNDEPACGAARPRWTQSIESRRAAARFEPDADVPVDPNAIEAAEAKPTAPRRAAAAAAETGRRSRRAGRLHVAAAEGEEASVEGPRHGSRI